MSSSFNAPIVMPASSIAGLSADQDIKHFRNCLKRPYTSVSLVLLRFILVYSVLGNSSEKKLKGYQYSWICNVTDYSVMLAFSSDQDFDSSSRKPLILDICHYYSFYGYNFMFTGTSWTKV